MSAPARQVRVRRATAVPGRARTAPVRRRAPHRTLRVAAKPKARRGTAAFFVLSTLVLVAMVFGLAAMNAVLAQGAFKMRALSLEGRSLQLRNGDLRLQVADLSSPRRITSEAQKLELELPDTSRIQVIDLHDVGKEVQVADRHGRDGKHDRRRADEPRPPRAPQEPGGTG